MAIIQHPLHQGITVDTGTATQSNPDVPIWNYTATLEGRPFELEGITVSPEALERDLGDDTSDAYISLAAALKASRQQQVSAGTDRGIIEGTIFPALTRTPANWLGAPADLANVVRGAVDVGINTARWAAGGFDEFPDDRILSSDPKDVIGGSAQIARGMQNIGDLAREGIRATEEAGLNVTIPWVGTPVGARTPLDLFAFDTTPDESTKTREYVSLITQIIGAAPVEGAMIANLAARLAKTTRSPTAERVYEAMSEMQLNNPIRAAATETAMGAAAGAGMVTSVEALEAAYPNAPEWMKSIVMAGGGLAFPIGAMTAGSTLWDVGLVTPIVKWPLQILRGMGESLTTSGAEKASARAIETMGGDWKRRHEILGVTGQLRLALKEGRNMDEATRIAFTTPQLARNEANVLEAQFQAARANMSDVEVLSAQKLIQDLRQFANFQEGQLKTLSTSKGVGAAAYAKYSERMMDRRDSIFAALDDAILKLDLGGQSDAGVDPSVIRQDYDQAVDGNYVYNVNRIRAMQEGRLGDNVTPEQTQAISQAYDNALAKMDDGAQQALRDAQERVEAIRKGMPKDMNDQDRLDFNTWIRRELETAYQEIDGFEDVLWNSIGGMNRPKTESYFGPDGTDMGPQVLIDGVPIGEHFAAKATALKAGERENQTKWLWKLAGRDALVEQAGKGGGPDAERVAKQNVIVKQNEANVARLDNQLSAASDKLRGLQETPSVNPELRKARLEVQKLEDELAAIPDGRTIEDPTVIRRANAVMQKLAGLRGTVKRLEAEPYTDSALTKANDVFLKAQDDVEKAKIALGTSKGNLEISLGKGVTDENGNPVKLEDEIVDTSALGVRLIDGTQVGREPQEVQNIISHLKAEMAAEGGRKNRRPAKIAAIGEIIDDLQRALGDSDNFDVNTVQLDAARRMTATKKELFERGEVGRIRGFNTRREADTQLESTIDKIASPTQQEVSLRQLEAALTGVARGEGTPFQIITREDGTVGPELDPNFGLQKYAEGPPPPFESIDVGGSRSLGLRVAEGTQPTEANIEIIRNTLWDRFRGFDSGEKFDTAGAARWLENNGAAIRWLERATKQDTGFENLVNAERIVKTIESSAQGDINRTVETLRKNGAFNEEFTEEGFRLILREQQKRQSNLKSAASFLDSPDPTVMGRNFLTKFFDNPNVLGETLKLLDNGALPDGSNPALEGFKRSVAEALIERSLTTKGGGSSASVEADTLSASLNRTVKLWDPDALIGLAQDSRTSKLLNELYGKDAPELFRKIAEGARLQSAISDAATPGVARQDKVSDEAAGNIGRIIGGWVAQFTPVSSLVLTGAGRRAGIEALGKVRGSAIDKLIIDFLMDPELALAAITKYPSVNPNQNASVWRRIKLWGHQKFITDNARRIERLGKTPGTLFEIGAETLDMREPDLPGGVGDLSAVQPAGPPPRRMAASVPRRDVTPASMMSQVNPVGPPPAAAGPAPGGPAPDSQQTLAGLSQMGLPLFANRGGYIGEKESGIMSVPCKPRQMVG